MKERSKLNGDLANLRLTLHRNVDGFHERIKSYEQLSSPILVLLYFCSDALQKYTLILISMCYKNVPRFIFATKSAYQETQRKWMKAWHGTDKVRNHLTSGTLKDVKRELKKWTVYYTNILIMLKLRPTKEDFRYVDTYLLRSHIDNEKRFCLANGFDPNFLKFHRNSL